MRSVLFTVKPMLAEDIVLLTTRTNRRRFYESRIFNPRRRTFDVETYHLLGKAKMFEEIFGLNENLGGKVKRFMRPKELDRRNMPNADEEKNRQRANAQAPAEED